MNKNSGTKKMLRPGFFCTTGPFYFFLTYKLHQAGTGPPYLRRKTQQSRCCWAKKTEAATNTLSNDSSVKETFGVKGKQDFPILKTLLCLLTQNKPRKGERVRKSRKEAFHFSKKNK